MWLYSCLSRVFPRSFTAKVFAITFVGTHIPLLASFAHVSYMQGVSTNHWHSLSVIGVATLLGTLTALISLHAILKPLYKIELSMLEFEKEGATQPLAENYQDEVGRLMKHTNRLVLNFVDRIEASQRDAETDPLTGILNRRGLQAKIKNYLVNDLSDAAVIYLDLDNFKVINDNFGHNVGDRVLCNVANAIQAVLRPGDFVARFGGEEFLVYLPSTQEKAACQIAERIRLAISEQVRVGRKRVTASLGVAAPDGVSKFRDLVAQADKATYRAKESGRNIVCLASKSRA